MAERVPAADPVGERAAMVLFVLAVCVFLWMGLFNVHQPLLEKHGFRQTQTALSAYWIQKEGFSLAYQTPVLGAPWSIPFEFPLYHAVVAWISSLTDIGLDAVGRVVNLLSTLAVCIPLYRSLRVLDVDRGAAHYANALFLTAPVYLFWAGSFMIEGMALFFTVSAGYYMLKIYRFGATTRDLALFGVVLTLALLQKVTTAAIFPLVGLCAFAWRGRPQLRAGCSMAAPPVRDAFRVLAVTAFAFVIGYAWVRYTDSVKSHNELGRFITSTALSQWNYGTLQQRFSKALWVDVLIDRILIPSSGWGVGVLALVGLFLTRNRVAIKRAALLGLVLFLGPIAMFTNLHFVHDYYQQANLVFMVAAIGVAVYAGCGLLGRSATIAAPALMTVLIAANLFFFYQIYYPLKASSISEENNQTLKVASFLRSHTPVDRPILILGYDWSSEVPYYAQRKAAAVPPWMGLEMVAARNPERFLQNRPSAIVSCPEANVDALRTAIATAFPQSHRMTVGACNIYLLPT